MPISQWRVCYLWAQTMCFLLLLLHLLPSLWRSGSSASMHRRTHAYSALDTEPQSLSETHSLVVLFIGFFATALLWCAAVIILRQRLLALNKPRHVATWQQQMLRYMLCCCHIYYFYFLFLNLFALLVLVVFCIKFLVTNLNLWVWKIFINLSLLV